MGRASGSAFADGGFVRLAPLRLAFEPPFSWKSGIMLRIRAGLRAEDGEGISVDEQKLTHIDEKGEVRMVDVSDKDDTKRVAVAEGFISMRPETLEMITDGTAAKGDVLACARVAGVMAAKKTSELIPMCHPLMITKAKLECEAVRAGERSDGRIGIHVRATCGVTGKTGIEMEALTAASVACLTVYDMCKAVDRGMEIMDVRLLKKDGGKTGLWLRS